MNTTKLKQYYAKLDKTTIYEHSNDSINISRQLKTMHDITDVDSLEKCLMLHDIGKCIDDFQNNIASTHRNLRHEYLSASYSDLTVDERIAILLHHKNLEYFKEVIGSYYYEPQLEEIRDKLGWEFENIEQFIKDMSRPRKSKEILHNKELILKLGYLKLCDHIASANIKIIDKGFNAEEIFNFTEYRSIQEQVLDMKIKDNIIIQAPTGCGKTETALLWSNKLQNEDKSRRIFYLLPYTASINALYKRFKEQKISVGALHSKVKSLLLREDDVDNIEEEMQLFQKNTKQITICTIYQVLKVVFSAKNWEMMLAQFKNSIFIVDEIHCFDIKQFTLLVETLRWLKEEFNINICVMSASIATDMLNVIKDRLNINTVIRAEKKDYLVRHKIYYKDETIFNNLDYIKELIEQGMKVLICVNNVSTSQELYKILEDIYIDKNIKLIHGRFNDRDRSIIEKDIDDCDVLIGTQAIEVSLNIDFDVMFTEIAPFDSLLQRFGRVNRRGLKGIANIFIYNQLSKSIYDPIIINNTFNVIKEIEDIDKGIIYEEKTIHYLDKVYTEFHNHIYKRYTIELNQLISSLFVGVINKNINEEMINNETIKVLPIQLFDEYIKFIENRRFIEANELFVNTYMSNLVTYKDKYDIYISKCIYDERGLTKEEYV